MGEDNYKSCAKSGGHEKENFQTEGKLINEDLCFNCKRSLANSQHIINIAGHSRRWHPHCFTCSVCREPMDRKQSCHVFRDQIVCRSDFARLKRDHSIRCARCHWPIAASDWVRRASSHVYHIACFNCDVCLRQLNTGEQFIISSESSSSSSSSPPPPLNGDQDSQLSVRLLCRLHFTVDPTTTTPINKRPRRSSTPTRSASKKMRASLELECQPTCRLSTPDDYLHLLSTAATATTTTTINTNSETISETPNELACPPLSSSISNSSASSTPTSSTIHAHYASGPAGPMTPTGSQSGAPSASSLPCKSKRVRTTFTEDQLSILQTQFQLDSNPDGQDLERIATITGLSKRVTQVWFQNSRARQKKYLIKRKPSGVGGGANFTSQSSQDNSRTGSPIGGDNGGASGQQNYCLSTYPHEHPFGGGEPNSAATATTASVLVAEQCNNETRAQWLSSTSSAPISVGRNNHEEDDEDSSDESMAMNDLDDEDSRDSTPSSMIRNENFMTN